jgi:hypothetical protein
MDSNRFDQLTRTFVATSRRRLLRLLAASTLTGTVAAGEWQETAARCRRRRRCPERDNHWGNRQIPSSWHSSQPVSGTQRPPITPLHCVTAQ